MNNEMPESNKTERDNKGTSSGLGLLLALLLAFAPGAMLLGMLTSKPNLTSLRIVLFCGFSLACSGVSACLLCLRGRLLWILAGVLFLIVNMLIAGFVFFSGCGTLFESIH